MTNVISTEFVPTVEAGNRKSLPRNTRKATPKKGSLSAALLALRPLLVNQGIAEDATNGGLRSVAKAVNVEAENRKWFLTDMANDPETKRVRAMFEANVEAAAEDKRITRTAAYSMLLAVNVNWKRVRGYAAELSSDVKMTKAERADAETLAAYVKPKVKDKKGTPAKAAAWDKRVPDEISSLYKFLYRKEVDSEIAVADLADMQSILLRHKVDVSKLETDEKKPAKKK